MTTTTAVPRKTYNPGLLLDAVRARLSLDSDLALAEALDVPPSVISQIRYRNYPVGPSLLIAMHDLTSMSVAELREIMHDRRKRTRTPYDEDFLHDNPSYAQSLASVEEHERFYFFLASGLTLLYMMWILSH